MDAGRRELGREAQRLRAPMAHRQLLELLGDPLAGAAVEDARAIVPRGRVDAVSIHRPEHAGGALGWPHVHAGVGSLGGVQQGGRVRVTPRGGGIGAEEGGGAALERR